MHPKMEIDYTGYGKGTIGLLHSLLLKQSTLSDRKIIQKLYSMSLYDIREIIRIIRYTKPSILRLHVIRGTQYTTTHCFIGKISVKKKVCISILNCHPGNQFKTEGFWFVFKSFCYHISTEFPKKIWRWWGFFFGGGGGRKEPTRMHMLTL